MRYAAGREGMKIGSWVSLRLKEAAERALSTDRTTGCAKEMSGDVTPRFSPDETLDTLHRIIGLTVRNQEFFERRISTLEGQLREMTDAHQKFLISVLADKIDVDKSNM